MEPYLRIKQAYRCLKLVIWKQPVVWQQVYLFIFHCGHTSANGPRVFSFKFSSQILSWKTGTTQSSCFLFPNQTSLKRTKLSLVFLTIKALSKPPSQFRMFFVSISLFSTFNFSLSRLLSSSPPDLTPPSTCLKSLAQFRFVPCLFQILWTQRLFH